jgi:hypothetical protein
MALYLLQVAYTSRAWAAQLRNPQNRREVVSPVAVKGLVATWLQPIGRR